ncbi:MAG: Asp-tRNA(Asn)/Glu-tRNA(Gln) amidotransferase subunit GatC [Candidatus Krumholzibacteriia bacterium]|nr:Asp-tRNA(Asn)/Glu-tRNA(Gln) amidotransferase subunit GatC [bacterium]MCB9512865.1 Asp-tRNA(Asn)/Glu-tRNA(Gln) amidotransferase subunit GatC [Candidatus Latescibacterota bacterium]MCB9516949.1 Asp-tRNA(Asn)/Glu-tRNA(Gln) amidotransferase subunit GatC [Candidatus Latescibacterota bacterium]
MKIDRALLLHLERLSRLELAEDERAAMMDDLSRVLDYAERLAALDAELPGATLDGALRDDAVRPSLDAATPLALAPAVEEGHFLVPPVLEIEGKP